MEETNNFKPVISRQSTTKYHGSYKIWFTNSSAAWKTFMQGIYQELLFSTFLKQVQEFEKICSCLETLKGGNKWGSANSWVGAGGARDVWMWSWMRGVMGSPPTLVFDLLFDHRQNKPNMKDNGALPALTPGSQSSQSRNKTRARLH